MVKLMRWFILCSLTLLLIVCITIISILERLISTNKSRRVGIKNCRDASDKIAKIPGELIIEFNFFSFKSVRVGISRM